MTNEKQVWAVVAVWFSLYQNSNTVVWSSISSSSCVCSLLLLFIKRLVTCCCCCCSAVVAIVRQCSPSLPLPFSHPPHHETSAAAAAVVCDQYGRRKLQQLAANAKRCWLRCLCMRSCVHVQGCACGSVVDAILIASTNYNLLVEESKSLCQRQSSDNDRRQRCNLLLYLSSVICYHSQQSVAIMTTPYTSITTHSSSSSRFTLTWLF